MSRRNVAAGTARLCRMIGERAARLRFVPARVRFRCRGHGEAWGIFTHMTPEERLLLYTLALRQRKGAVLVEVGSYLGASACFLAAAAGELGEGAAVHCVDTWHNDAMSEGSRDTWNEFHSNTRRHSSAIVAHRGLSVEVARSFDREVDLLFLDGDHSYEGCRSDVLAWLPRVRRGGVLVLHDFGWAEGVQRVVSELIMPARSGPGHVLQNTFWTTL